MRAIHFLAREWGVPVEEVARLYESERAALALTARVTGYLPILAIRKVRETLRRRSDSRPVESPHPSPRSA
jgi:hypothetical protein